MLNARRCLIAGALLGASGVVLGAWGAHGLSAFLGHSNTQAWQTAVLYQLIHALVLLCLAALMSVRPSAPIKFAASAVLVGVCLFSGSLYALTLGAPGWLGPVTPLGGLAMIFGWLGLLYAAIKWPQAE